MLKTLNLKNVVLIESCQIEFEKGLHILSGETGAGKTALIEAIGLILGERADHSIIRKNADKAIVEAAFDIAHLNDVQKVLEDAGIDCDLREYLLIRREITRDGRSRSFVNCQMVTLPLLQKIGRQLVDLIGQHSHAELRSSDYQRQILDLFAELSELLQEYQSLLTVEKNLKDELEALQKRTVEKEKKLDIYRMQLEELREIQLKDGEEEALFEEYSRLSHAQELAEKIQGILQGLTESPRAIVPELSRYKNIAESLMKIDKTLEEPFSLLKNASIELSETARALSHYLSMLDRDPSRFSYLENRLSLIQQIKRKYGKTYQEIQCYQKNLERELDQLENLEEEIEKCSLQLNIAEEKTQDSALQLTKRRREQAKILQAQLTSALQDLNMPHAEVSIEVSQVARHAFGENLVQFWIRANRGESPALVKESTSGGELARLLFAIKTTLAEKNNTPTIFFDEIDANVGGETAALLGEKFHDLGKCRQVLCITHFPQVACRADHHLRALKEEREGRTQARIELLNAKEREAELLRMLGGKKSALVSNLR